jgi:hypothetical protein
LRLRRDRFAKSAGRIEKHRLELDVENAGCPEHMNQGSRSLGTCQQVGLIHAERGQALGFLYKTCCQGKVLVPAPLPTKKRCGAGG